MKVESAILFACTGCVAALVGEIAWVRLGGRPPDLGFAGAALGLAVFALLFAVLIYGYAALSRAVRRDGAWVSAYGLSAASGLPFWFILTPSHDFLRSRFGLPDRSWVVEAALLCAASFEVIRMSSRLLSRRPNPALERTPLAERRRF